MNYRSKTAAMCLCFFLGVFGAHWFYLGRFQWGWMYTWVSLGSWPLACVVASGTSDAPLIGAFFFVLAGLLQFGLLLVVTYDFFCLIAMHPRRFDLEFNR